MFSKACTPQGCFESPVVQTARSKHHWSTVNNDRLLITLMSETMPTSPRAVNIGHSPLLQSVTPAILDPARQSELLQARRKFSSSLESDVLDYLHYGPQQLEECVKHLHTMFSNIANNPNEPKYRRVSCNLHVRLTGWPYTLLIYMIQQVTQMQLECTKHS